MTLAQTVVGAARMPRVAWSFSALGYRRRARQFRASDLAGSLAGQCMLVTGANGGIGFAIAEALARRDADVWLLCRSRERGERACEQLRGLGTGAPRLEVVDVADFASIDRFVQRCDTPRIDALIHNAGALVHSAALTADQLETTLACHVVGPQRLTHGLAERLRTAPDPRVIYVASGGMYSERLHIEDLLLPPQPFDGVRAYALAKRAQVVLVGQWSQALPDVRFFAMHPGWADTPGVQTALPRFYKLTRRWLRTPAEAADTAVWLAAYPNLDLLSGTFAFDRDIAPHHWVPGTRVSDDEHARLWRSIEQLARATG